MKKYLLVGALTVLVAAPAFADFGSDFKRLVDSSNMATRDMATLTAASDLCGYSTAEMTPGVGFALTEGDVDFRKVIALTTMMRELGSHREDARQMICSRAREISAQ